MEKLRANQAQTNWKVIIAVVVGVLLLVAPMLIVDAYKARRAMREHEQMMSLRSLVIEKVEAYEKVNGHYPDTIDVLSFSNSPVEITMARDLRKIRYRRTPSGYGVGFDGDYGEVFR